jgi:hypothetical protein
MSFFDDTAFDTPSLPQALCAYAKSAYSLTKSECVP